MLVGAPENRHNYCAALARLQAWESDVMSEFDWQSPTAYKKDAKCRSRPISLGSTFADCAIENGAERFRP
jgi:hypothetical protein